MKIVLLLGGCLLVALGECTVSGERPNWLKKLTDDLERMKQKLKEDRERMEAEARKMRQKAEVEQKSMYAELDRLKQKCGNKGIMTNGTDANVQNGRRVGVIMYQTNGMVNFLEQTVNPATGKIEKGYYSLDLNDPNAKPICGKPTGVFVDNKAMILSH